MINKTAKNKMNKRGDIPIVILVVGVLALCILAILSFYTSTNSVKSGFSSIDTVVEAGLIKEKISFYENLGYNKERIKSLLDIQEDSQDKIIISRDSVKVVFPWS